MIVSKWTALLLACMVTFGSYFSFDVPSALHNQMFRFFCFEGGVECSDAQFEFDFSLMYSMYSLPNIVLPLLSGWLYDRFGSTFVLILFSILVVFGNFIGTVASRRVNITGYIIGRFVFGLGAESLGVAANSVISRWFKHQELALALGINLAICKMSGALTDWVSPIVENQIGVIGLSYSVLGLCCFCFFLTVVLTKCEPATRCDLNSIDSMLHRENLKTKWIEVEKTNVDKTSDLVVNSTIAGTILIKDDVKIASTSFVVLLIFSFVMYGVFIPFNNIANASLVQIYFTKTSHSDSGNKYDSYDKEAAASRLQSIPYLLAMMLSPLLGLAVDRFGHRAHQLIFAALALVLAHGLILFAHDSLAPFYPLFLIGCAYSVFGSVVWACVPLLVADAHIGTAFGLMACFQNSAQFIVPLVVQHVFNAHGRDFLACEELFVVLSLCAFFISIVIYLYDNYYGDNSLRCPIACSEYREYIVTESVEYMSVESRAVADDNRSLMHDYGSIELT